MKFLFPYFLFFAAAILIPILIHLFNFRRYKTVYFSNVEFLKNIKKESKKKSQIKQLLILFARILAILAIVFAFAQPFIPAEKGQQNSGNMVVAIYIDNSFSMNVNSEAGLLVEAARNKAIEIASEYEPGTKFMLVTNDLLPKHKHFFNKEQFIQQVAEVGLSPKTIPLSQAYNRIFDSFLDLGNNTGKATYILSDFQRNITDIENFKVDTSLWAYLMPFTSSKINNLYIDSCWFETPGRKLGEEELLVKVVNSADEEYQNLPLKFFLNDTLKAISNFNIGAQDEITVPLSFTNINSGFQHGRVELTDYPLTHDNSFYLSYNIAPQVNAVAIYADTPSSKEGLNYMEALFANDPYINLEAMSLRNLKINQFPDYNTFIILNLPKFTGGLVNELQKMAANGASIIFFPGLEGDIASYNRFLQAFSTNLATEPDTSSQKLAGLAYEHPYFKDIFKEKGDNPFMPEINGLWKFTNNTRVNETPLLWFRNNTKALGTTSYNQGALHTFSFPLNQANHAFATNILFVPVIYSLTLNSIPRQTIYYVAGDDHFVLINGSNPTNKDYPLHITCPATGTDFIPDAMVSNANNIRLGLSAMNIKAGHYNVVSGDSVVATLSFNYNRDESELSYLSEDELGKEVAGLNNGQISIIKNASGSFAEVFDEIQHGKQLWKFFIVLALAFILTEALIIKFWK